MKTILLVGYGWFASIPEGETNNAEWIARALDGEILRTQDGSEAKVHALVVPVIWSEAFAPVETAVRTLAPDIVLALGTDASASAMRPEPWGVNYMKGKDAARDGRITEMDAPIAPGAAPFLRGTLPYDRMTLAMLRSEIPAQTGTLSDAEAGAPLEKKSTTGLYLCNYMTYCLAQLAQENPALRAGFMHVPTQPQYACARRMAQGTDALSMPMPPSMPIEMMIRGTREALRACMEDE